MTNCNNQISEDEAYEEARKCAHRIIKAREKTSHDLLKRLQEKSHGRKMSEKVVERFIEVGLVDDERFSEIYIRSAQYSGKGWQRIVRELQQKGIDTQCLEPPLDEEELERANQVIARFAIETYKDRQKLLRKLVTRGYSYGIAKQAIAAKVSESGEGDGQPLPENFGSTSSFEVTF